MEDSTASDVVPQVRVGVAAFLFSSSDPSKFILGRRKGSHGAGTYALPGGHLDFGETFEECAAREVWEETGLRVDRHDYEDVQYSDVERERKSEERGLRFLTCTNDIMADGKHYVTIFMTGTVDNAHGIEPRVMEPDKCEGWEWVSWGELVQIAETQRLREVLIERGRIGDDEERLTMEEKGREEKKLFQPLRDLLVQRPGVLPRPD